MEQNIILVDDEFFDRFDCNYDEFIQYEMERALRKSESEGV